MTKQLIAGVYNTDKSQGYLDNYQQFFARWVNKDIRLLELGVKKGGSLELWRDFFDHGKIVGLDRAPLSIEDSSKRIHIYIGSQDDTELLDRLSQDTAPQGFDIVIDDCSHIGELTRISFWHLFRHHLKPGGIYVIEDWGTGYWSTYPDGRPLNRRRHRRMASALPSFRLRLFKRLLRRLRNPVLKHYADKAILYALPRRFPSHDAGMVGFVKTLVDECAMADVSHPRWGVPPNRQPIVKSVHYYPGQVFVIKAACQ